MAGTVTKSDGTAERRASQAMLKAKRKAIGHRITVGADKAYDTKDHVENLRAVTPHVEQNKSPTKTGNLAQRPPFEFTVYRRHRTHQTPSCSKRSSPMVSTVSEEGHDPDPEIGCHLGKLRKDPNKAARYVEPNIQITLKTLHTGTATPQIFRFFRRLKGTQ